MIAGNSGATGLPDSVKVTILAWFNICTINCLFSDILKPYASLPPATQDRQQLHTGLVTAKTRPYRRGGMAAAHLSSAMEFQS